MNVIHILSDIYHFEHVEFKSCSPLVLDLVTKLLVVDPKKRFSAEENKRAYEKIFLDMKFTI